MHRLFIAFVALGIAMPLYFSAGIGRAPRTVFAECESAAEGRNVDGAYFAELPVCTAYRLRDGSETREFPAHQSDFHHAEPVYETLAGWERPLDGVDELDGLPEAARRYVDLVEREGGVAVTLVGTGRERERVLARGGQAAYSTALPVSRP